MRTLLRWVVSRFGSLSLRKLMRSASNQMYCSYLLVGWLGLPTLGDFLGDFHLPSLREMVAPSPASYQAATIPPATNHQPASPAASHPVEFYGDHATGNEAPNNCVGHNASKTVVYFKNTWNTWPNQYGYGDMHDTPSRYLLIFDFFW